MKNILEQLKTAGWLIDTFQPKGEPFPWSMKICRQMQSGEKIIITAYLDPTKELSESETEKRILSALKSEQIKNADLIEKCRYIDALSEITGKVKVQRTKKAAISAKIKSENDEAMEKLADKIDDKAEQISILVEEPKKRRRTVKSEIEASVKKTTPVKKAVVKKKAKSIAKAEPSKAKKQAPESSKSAVSRAKSVRTKTVSSKVKMSVKQAKTAKKAVSAMSKKRTKK